MLNGDKDRQAQLLAEKHYLVEDGITEIFRIRRTEDVEQLPDEPIKLLEVNRDTIPSGVMPLHFGPAPASGISYPSAIVEVTPEEFHRIRSRELELPTGWVVSDSPLPRPVSN